MSRTTHDASLAGRRSTGRAHALAAAVATAAAAAMPAPLAAQLVPGLGTRPDPGLLELFASRKEDAGQPLFGGIALSRYGGAFGVRVSGALHVVDRGAGTASALGVPVFDRGVGGGRGGRGGASGAVPGGTAGDLGGNGAWASPGIGAWNADADLVFEPLRPIPVLRALVLGFSPYAFVGIGAQGLRPTDGRDTTRATYSVGAGVRHVLLGRAGLMAEARYRRGLTGDTTSFTSDLRHRLEYRAGLTIGFGGRRNARAVAPAVPVVAAPAPAPVVAPTAPVAPLPPAVVSVASVLDLAEGLLGTPFRDGASSPSDGFGAAGFVQHVFARQGVQLPATARAMAGEGSAVSLRIGALQPGDLVFFANDGANVDHVAIYMGHDRIIHSSASAGRVQADLLGDGERGRWFAEHLVAARRVVAAAPASRPTGEGDGAPRAGRSP